MLSFFLGFSRNHGLGLFSVSRDRPRRFDYVLARFRQASSKSWSIFRLWCFSDTSARLTLACRVDTTGIIQLSNTQANVHPSLTKIKWDLQRARTPYGMLSVERLIYVASEHVRTVSLETE